MTAAGCGVIATIIPVLLLAGLFDVPLLHLGTWRAPNEQELTGPRMRSRRIRRTLSATVFPVIGTLILTGMTIAIVGAAGDGFREDDEFQLSMIWTSFALSTFLVVVSVVIRVLNARDEEARQYSEALSTVARDAAILRHLQEERELTEAMLRELRRLRGQTSSHQSVANDRSQARRGPSENPPE